MKKSAALLSLMLMSGYLVGCGTNCPPCQLAPSNRCAGWRAIYPSRQDALTDETKRQILSHNDWGANQGCWASP